MKNKQTGYRYDDCGHWNPVEVKEKDLIPRYTEENIVRECEQLLECPECKTNAYIAFDFDGFARKRVKINIK